MTQKSYLAAYPQPSEETIKEDFGHLARVYAAGRIKRTRERFGVIDCRLNSDLIENGEVYDSPQTMVNENGKPSFIYTGPYTYGCDHGCAHTKSRGTNTHGSGIGGCNEAMMPHDALFTKTGRWKSFKERNEFVAEAILARSFDGIRKCNLFFAWIDDHECHGTLVEIGYAFAKGKPILIAHPPHIKPKGELWFAFECATKVIVCEDPAEAFIKATIYGGEDLELL